ncbi:MAG: ABC transporter ATP-binding protein [Firmicutes bacterium]|nr:ABC transporter ATP-binding protein [Bacillota bacterium]
MESSLLVIKNLNVNFRTRAGLVRAANGVSLEIRKGETLALVGESGCGKTIIALAIMRLLVENALITGEILFRGQNLLGLNEEEMRNIRGREIAAIFEQPASCLNPVMQIGEQIAEAVMAHEKCPKREAKMRAKEIMEMVGIPAVRYRNYPHEFSGGMQQRAMIAMALACRPSLLIADEPTTALDVTVQAQILELLKELTLKNNTAMLLITHDLGIIAEMADTVAVMYAGTILERGSIKSILKNPQHPYTMALLGAIGEEELNPLPGSVASLCALPPGCPFHPRCVLAGEICFRKMPELISYNGSKVRCHYAGRSKAVV